MFEKHPHSYRRIGRCRLPLSALSEAGQRLNLSILERHDEGVAAVERQLPCVCGCVFFVVCLFVVLLFSKLFRKSV